MDRASSPLPVTALIAEWGATTPSTAFTQRARRAACHALLDWTGVTLAGAREPLVDLLVADALACEEAGSFPLIGRAERLAPATAALVNGAASHALDYDDINKRLGGHPTVAVLPAVLSLASSHALSGAAFLDALTVGIEVACTLGEMMGHAHYLQGFHITATVGSVAAAAGAARAMGLSADQTAHALALAATQAAGLKANFGSMAKPLRAGKAAENGLRSARWAASGFTAMPTALEASQGFGAALSPNFQPQVVRPNPDGPFGIEDNVYKYHAACYFTHSAIEAANRLRESGIAASQIAAVSLRVPAQHRLVCDILDPTTGMEVKFSIRHLVAMALHGIALDDPAIFSTETATRADLCALRALISLEPAEHESRMAAEVSVTTHDGATHARFEDVSAPASNLDQQEARLLAKYKALTNPILGAADSDALARAVLSMAEAPSLKPYLDLAARAP